MSIDREEWRHRELWRKGKDQDDACDAVSAAAVETRWMGTGEAADPDQRKVRRFIAALEKQGFEVRRK